MKIIELECIGSTNDYCKAVDSGEDLAVFAKRQSGGKGTKGRSFLSEEGGIYLTVLRHLKNFPAADAFKIMIDCSVAVCKTVEDFGVKPRIKWANDVLIGSKKICGTLIENRISGDGISRSIAGMGLNVNNPLSEDIADIATSMSLELGRMLDLRAVKERLLQRLEGHYSIEEYKSYIDWFGREITLVTGGEVAVVEACDVAENGNLIVKRGGNMLEIPSGEVSLRL